MPRHSDIFFLFQHKNELYLVGDKHVQDVPKPRELIQRMNQIEKLREIAESMGLNIAVDKTRKRTAHLTEAGRERIIRAAKKPRGPRPDEVKQKISRTMRGTRIGENNPMYGRRHTPETRMKMAIAYRHRERMRWVVSPENKSTRIPWSAPIPEGYQLGRYYDKYREPLPEFD